MTACMDCIPSVHLTVADILMYDSKLRVERWRMSYGSPNKVSRLSCRHNQYLEIKLTSIDSLSPKKEEEK